MGYYLLVKGRVQMRRFKEDEIEFKIKTITLLSSVKDELVKSVTLKIDVQNISAEMINELQRLVQENKGGTELRFLLLDPEEKISLPMFSRTMRIRLNHELTDFLDDYPGIEYKVN